MDVFHANTVVRPLDPSMSSEDQLEGTVDKSVGLELSRLPSSSLSSDPETGAELNEQEREPLTHASDKSTSSHFSSSRPLRSIDSILPCSRLHRVGNNYVLLQGRGGRLIVTFGPHWPGVFATHVVLIIATIFFVHQWLVPHFAVVFSVIALGFFCLSILFLLLTACTDPGIVRASPVLADDTAEQSPFCDICELYQPPHTMHCEDCNCCIEKLDHHCPWMGKCIGKGNMLWFKLFNITWIVYLIYFCSIAVLMRV